MMGVPKQLCSPNIQQKFIDAKRNMISRRIQNMIEHRTMYEWQLPQLKPKVLKLRENNSVVSNKTKSGSMGARQSIGVNQH